MPLGLVLRVFPGPTGARLGGSVDSPGSALGVVGLGKLLSDGSELGKELPGKGVAWAAPLPSRVKSAPLSRCSVTPVTWSFARAASLALCGSPSLATSLASSIASLASRNASSVCSTRSLNASAATA